MLCDRREALTRRRVCVGFPVSPSRRKTKLTLPHRGEGRGVTCDPVVQRQGARASAYFFFVSPYPGVRARSTTCVLGCSRAFFTVAKCPVLASRPRGEVFDSLPISPPSGPSKLNSLSEPADLLLASAVPLSARGRSISGTSPRTFLNAVPIRLECPSEETLLCLFPWSPLTSFHHDRRSASYHNPLLPARRTL